MSSARTSSLYCELKSSKLEFGGDSPQVGLAHNWQYFDGALGNVLQGLNEKMTRKFERAGDKSDFLALQYYCRVTFPSFYQPIPPFKIKGKGRDYGDHSGFGDIYPPGIYEHLKRMNEMYPNKEIYITEFGFSDARDKKRPYWILETMRYVLEAMRAGVPIKGMLLWSLVNNFEWERGMEQKFGLFDEKDLSKPLQASSGDNIRSWEAWQTVGLAITQPTLDNIQNLQIAYEKAKRLYAQADY